MVALIEFFVHFFPKIINSAILSIHTLKSRVAIRITEKNYKIAIPVESRILNRNNLTT